VGLCLIGALLLIGMALPVFGLRLGFSDEGNFPEDSTTRKAYDLLAEGFGPGFNGPFLMVAELPDGFDAEALAPIQAAVQDDQGVVFVTPAMPNDEKDPAAATAVQWAVIPTSSPQAEETTETVNRLRADVLPAAEQAAGVDVALTGSVPVQVDFSEYLASRLPVFFGAVLALSFLLLMSVFRSLLVPIKAVVMNLLSIGRQPMASWWPSSSGVGPSSSSASARAARSNPGRPDDDVRHRLRPLHGLRGLPAVTHAGGVATAPATTIARWPTGWPPQPG
jgi:RND superfamily putative drug exporter